MKPSVQHCRIFGSLSWVYINAFLRTKMDPKSKRMFFVGYSNTSKVYRFQNPLTCKVAESSNYTIDEASGKFPNDIPPDPSQDQFTYFPIQNHSGQPLAPYQIAFPVITPTTTRHSGPQVSARSTKSVGGLLSNLPSNSIYHLRSSPMTAANSADINTL